MISPKNPDVPSCRLLRVVVATLLILQSAAAIPSDSKDKPAPGRMLTGKVLDKHDNPVVNSVVYLSNTRTHAITSYIVGPDGFYQFPQLSPNVDYEVYAQFQGHKSDTKTVSQFDDRKQVNIVLRIDLK
ncbi:MAG TPA: carboxypeptidase-like regulatory domain-containing protein [Terriglobales bacterium]|nr:carboxypeptidase-like regulatory domain-containing protein [Terriglobales bacterium]